MRSDPDRGEAGAGRLDSCYQREQVIDGMGCPGVRVGTCVAGNLRPGAEVQRKQLAPWVEGMQVFVCQAGMVECAGKVEAEVVGGAECAVGGGAWSMASIRLRTSR